MQIVRTAASKVTSELETKQELQCWVLDQLTILGEAMGESLTPERLSIYAQDLSSDLTQGQLAPAFEKARRELKFFPKIAELRTLAGADEKEREDAEMRQAWDLVQRFVSKRVWTDPHGVCRVDGEQDLPDRVRDSVRRSGGLRAYLWMTEKDFPFLQQRFFDEYRAWVRVERLPASILARLTMPRPRLIAPVETEAHAPAAPLRSPVEEIVKKIPALTEAEIRDRRALLRRQTLTIMNKTKND
jgi:hypothetical protein